MFLLLLPTAIAGYGDVDDQDHPNWEDRALHMYTNMARVDPAAFKDEYKAGGCNFDKDFSQEEKTPKTAYFYSRPLNKVARLHSKDMNQTGELDHTSSDGTSFGERVSAVYSEGAIGENIAWNYGLWGSVFQGWMCSTSGHRENLMSPLYVELGTGVAGAYTTQNFGAGSPDTSSRIAMGLHEPENPKPGNEVTFWVDYQGKSGAELVLWLDGVDYTMARVYGEEDSGIWSTEVAMPESDAGCSAYYFSWEQGSNAGVFPQDGSYLMGKDCKDLWVDAQYEEPTDPDEPDPNDGDPDPDPNDSEDDPRIGDGNGPNAEQPGGCSTLPAGSAGVVWLLALGGLLLRRRD